MEHASRLEEREAELKKEYAKLHDRYTELFKTHVDYMERTKLLLSGGQLTNERSESSRISSHRLSVGHNSGPISFGFASLEVAEGVDSLPTSPISSSHSSPRFVFNFYVENCFESSYLVYTVNWTTRITREEFIQQRNLRRLIQLI